MLIDRARRIGAASATALALAALLTGPVKADVAAATPGPNRIVVDAPDSLRGVQPLPTPVQAPDGVPEIRKVDPAEAKAEAPSIYAEGVASYYGHELAGNRTANGERFNPRELTAAHRTLPMGTRIKVTNTTNGKSVIVRINDRGPFAKKRIIDVSLAAAERISMVRSGTARVTLELIS